MNIVRESWSGKKMRFHAFFKRKRVNIDLRKFAPSTYSNRDQNVARVTLVRGSEWGWGGVHMSVAG